MYGDLLLMLPFFFILVFLSLIDITEILLKVALNTINQPTIFLRYIKLSVTFLKNRKYTVTLTYIYPNFQFNEKV